MAASVDPRDLPPPPPPPRAPDRPVLRWVERALVVIAALLLLGALKFAKAAVVPVLFALFVSLLLSPAVESLVRRRVPRVVAALLVMAVLLALVGSAVNATWRPARVWLDTAPATFQKLETKLRPLTGFIAKVESVSSQAERMTEPGDAKRDAPTPVALEPKGFVRSTQDWAITIVSMTFLTLFLLATDLAAIGRRAPPDSPLGHAGMIFERVKGELGRYFSAITLSNMTLGVGTTIAMYLLDMPNPLLWGVLAFALNFIPYAGSAITLVLLTAVALVSFDGAAKAVSVAGTYLLLTTLEGQVLQPVLVGRRLDLRPPVVLLGLWFGGWMWGVAGVALAMPVLVSVKAAAQEVARMRRAEAQPDIGTVRSRASDWLRESTRRYRRSVGGTDGGE
jgi:predicted PurR-regulated permease PerM